MYGVNNKYHTRPQNPLCQNVSCNLSTLSILFKKLVSSKLKVASSTYKSPPLVLLQLKNRHPHCRVIEGRVEDCTDHHWAACLAPIRRQQHLTTDLEKCQGTAQQPCACTRRASASRSMPWIGWGFFSFLPRTSMFEQEVIVRAVALGESSSLFQLANSFLRQL
jgi:hypothetical protein